MGAGKSTLARALSDALGVPRISFGEYIRSVLRQRGIQESRTALQGLGESLVEDDARGFTTAVLSGLWKEGAVVDGIRHVEVLQAIRDTAAPLPVVLVYVDVDEAVRKQRLAERGMSPEEIDAADAHSTEQQVGGELREMAALRVHGDRDLAEAVRLVSDWVKKNFTHNERS
jgi:adenylate kinase family enzyme